MPNKLFLLVFTLAPLLMGAINLNMELELAGERNHLTQVQVQPNEWVNVNQPPIHMRIKATPNKNNTVSLEFQIQEAVRGRRIPVGAPTIVTYWDKPAELAQRKQDNSLLYRLKVTPNKN